MLILSITTLKHLLNRAMLLKTGAIFGNIHFKLHGNYNMNT